MRTQGATIITDLTQLIYVSQPFGYESMILSGILNDARRCNLRDDITGALICRHDIYLQLLEGPSERIDATFTRISHDDRHLQVNTLIRRQVADRMFGNWAMLHDPVESLIWTKEQIADGVLDRLSPIEIIGMFESVSRNARPEHAN
ncbi:BLUF domain-containing protein [Maribius pontilimi]|uniref:BLUF domain-containing protein n=1 Tax=Palleronia pontilimi TaxID=1964209 RepID=A0A934MG69_9RHOB|nr:BLUF domain-containing protein [Palleronia pontilimi]MBJ3762109.1 BLUF domain-containing protein [Palleronia pontilimi]